MTFNFEDVLKDISSVEKSQPAALISETENKEFIKAISDKTTTSENVSLALLSIVAQKGGTSKKAQGTVYAVVNNVRLDLSTIRAVMKEKNYKFTFRQWARTNADFIQRIAEVYSIEGDLAKKIGRDYPEFSAQERVWLSNFQMDNPNCPTQVRDALMEHYKKLFPGKQSD